MDYPNPQEYYTKAEVDQMIAAAVAGLGLIEATDFGMAKTSKQAQEHRDYFVNILHPAMERSNWLGENYSNLEGEKPPEWIKKK